MTCRLLYLHLTESVKGCRSSLIAPWWNSAIQIKHNVYWFLVVLGVRVWASSEGVGFNILWKYNLFFETWRTQMKILNWFFKSKMGHGLLCVPKQNVIKLASFCLSLAAWWNQLVCFDDKTCKSFQPNFQKTTRNHCSSYYIIPSKEQLMFCSRTANHLTKLASINEWHNQDIIINNEKWLSNLPFMRTTKQIGDGDSFFVSFLAISAGDEQTRPLSFMMARSPTPTDG